MLDVAKSIPADLIEGGGLPQITAVECFDNGLTMCVGTSSGHVMMYDIRSSRPLLLKDHNNGAPIKGTTTLLLFIIYSYLGAISRVFSAHILPLARRGTYAT